MVKIVYAFFYAISLLPFGLLYCIADFEYFMMYRVIKYRRGIVRKNLTSSFLRNQKKRLSTSRRSSIAGSAITSSRLSNCSASVTRSCTSDSRSSTVRKWSNVSWKVRTWQLSWAITATGNGSHAWVSNCPSHAR